MQNNQKSENAANTQSRPDKERASRIEAILEAALQPETLIIEDESARHAGHHGHDGAAGTHLAITISAQKLKDLSRLERERAIHALLADELASGLHALRLKWA